MVKNEMLKPGRLLDNKGRLEQRGWAPQPVLQYNRKDIKAAPWRIKEWDFYQVTCDDYVLQLTIGDLSYVGNIAASIIDLRTGRFYTQSKNVAFPFGRLGLPSTAETGDAGYRTKGIEMSFEVRGNKRFISCRWDNFLNGQVFDTNVELTATGDDSMVIAIPYDDDPRAFYYNQKINCMKAQGYAKIGSEVYDFAPDKSFGLLDWGRGVWTFSNTWYWSNGSTLVDGIPFGFNLGYGFGDTSAASENTLFYDGKAHKISQVNFGMPAPGENLMQKWHFTSDDGRFDMYFEPIYDRFTHNTVLFLQMSCHQVFGRFTGRAVLDDGQVIEVKDMTAFAERSINRW